MNDEETEEYECTKNCPGKLKILVDENMLDDSLIKKLEKKFNVKKVIKNKGLDDKNVMYNQAMKERRVILTNDQDFYDDHKFPMHQTCGIIYITPKDIEGTTIALEKFLHTLDEKGYKLSRSCNFWWIGTKAKVLKTEFIIKFNGDKSHEQRFPYEP